MTEIIAESELTCPQCGHQSLDTMPTDNCQFYYECKGCGALLKPLPGDSPFDEAWAHRAYRAHMNAFEGLALFAPLAVAVQVTGLGNEVTALACATYFWARLVHYIVYTAGIPWLRTLSYAVGWVCNVLLILQLF